MLYELFDNVHANSAELKQSFEYLKNDHYTKGPHKFRFRSYSTGKWIKNQMHWSQAVKPFFQPDSINVYLGGVERNYPALEAACKEFIQSTVSQLVNLELVPKGDYDVAGHQIRVAAKQGEEVSPTPEGYHQDGFDFLAISSINNHNISGATTKLRELATQEEIYSNALQANTTLVLDDRALEHFVSPFSPLSDGRAFRDVVIITMQKRQA
ncbi:2OG-Fe dioxygenase family protein [Planctobacterium marinum]|uniref:2OG-Fe dioxygenase family protein n=1 Tax=Planctobacterium marinum TaxID=1631968 RepID=UPI001E520C81|nr:2OG-Fe dioxygenase family protein [Planctobacterium marinum]MCC2607748.1 2OG-Fe dioxygenase family protein [Planctobacterium marinum]